MKQGRKSFFIFLLPLLIWGGCAQIVSPDGGPKDSRAPQVVSYSPDSAATNFRKGKIYIRFDEFVQLKNIRSQLIVSPPVSPSPEVRTKGKGILIDMGDSLKPNTTYSINFGSAIADIHEGTVLENFRYVFSTGNLIDSLSLGGRIVDAFSTAPTKDAWVMLYENNTDSAPMKQKPAFVTRTKADGTFRITNLHEGSYKVFALADENSDFLYNVPGERIAFLGSQVSLSGNNDTLKMRMFQEGKAKLRIKKSGQPMVGVVVAALNRSPAQPATKLIGDLQKDEAFRFEFSADNDSLFCYLNNAKRDSLKLVLTENGQPFDTLRVRLIKTDPNKNTGRGSAERKFEVKTSVANGGKIDPGKSIALRFDLPLSDYKPDSIRVFCGKKKININPVLDKTNYRNVIIDGTFEEDSTYRLFIPSGVFTDYFGLKSDTIKLTFTVRNQSDYGTMKLKLNGLGGTMPRILHLMDEKGTILRSINVKEDQSILFENLLPGNYLLRMIDDENGSGKWDTGDYIANRQPEMVRFYTAPLKVRASWDMDVEWNFR